MADNFFSELKRRRVFRVAALYVVAAWALIQAAATILPALEFPAWTVKLVIILAAIGFPVALALGWAFDITPEGVQKTPSLETTRARLDPARLGVLALAIVVAVAGAYALMPRGASDPSQHVVAIAPFRTAGAEPSLGYLREGLVDLLAAQLTGEGGPRSVDPRTMLAAWQQAARGAAVDLTQEGAIEVATRVGAGQLMLGEVTGTPARIVINAAMLDARDGRVLARASVNGVQDSLPQLVDRLAAELLVGESQEGRHRTAVLTSTSLPALRSYLAGRVAFRRGRYQEANADFTRAFELDSTFALAVINMAEARLWLSTSYPSPFAQAWAHVRRLSRNDSLMLVAWSGPRFPRPVNGAESLEALRQASEVVPDRPETHLSIGDWLYHFGRQLGLGDQREAATRAFRRALELDSTFAAPIEHLIELAALQGDSAEVRRLGRLYAARDSVSDLVDYVRWRVAHATGDRAALNELRARADRIPNGSLVRIIAMSDILEHGLEDQAAYLRALEQHAAERGDWFVLFNVASNHGLPDLQRLALKNIAAQTRGSGLAESVRLRDVLFSNPDSSGAGEAVATLERLAGQPGPAAPGARGRLLEWRMFNGRFEGVPEFVAQLAQDSATVPGLAEAAIELDAVHAVLTRRADADQKLARLDSLLMTKPLWAIAPEVRLARLYELRGNPRRALEVVRRRPHQHVWTPPILAGSLRDEGRYAVAVGDRAGAVRAYEHYIALRKDAQTEPVRAELERVKLELARLTTETRR